MNTIHKAVAAAALVVTLGLSAFAAQPANAQMIHHYGYHPRQHRQANHLDHRAAVAASHGRYYRAARLRGHAAAVRSAARHGY